MSSMKSISIYFLFTALCIGMVLQLHATIRRVGFDQTQTPVAGLDYPTFQAAHDASASGDTIQLYPNMANTASYTGTITKKLVVLGAGYYYNSFTIPTNGIINGALQNLPGNIQTLSFTVTPNAAGTIFQGLSASSSFYIYTANTTDSINNITISRCRYTNINFDNAGVCNNWIVTQCIRPNISQAGYPVGFSNNRSITNLRVENCLGVSINYYGERQSPIGLNSGQILNSLLIANPSGQGLESIDSYLRLNNGAFVVQNCIINLNGQSFANYFAGINNTVWVNNLTNLAAANNPIFTNPGSTNNVFGVSFEQNQVFTGYPNNVNNGTTLNSSDAAFQLTANSPARNAGLIPGTATVTDCGPYGGTNPYKASGIPATPSFYRLNSPSSTTSGTTYPVTFSVRANN